RARVAPPLERVERAPQDEELLDRADALEADARVRRAPLHGEAERERAGAGGDDGEIGRLGDDRRVAAVAALQGRERTEPAVLFSDDALEQDAPAHADAGALHGGDRGEGADEAALHV